MKKKVKIFNELMVGLEEAIQFRAGKKTSLRISMVAPPPELKPSEIRQIRTSLKISQPQFALILGTSTGCVRSWEQGIRKPQKTAARLLSVVKHNPAALLESQVR